jgi:phosphoribosylformylglycinamidine synthase
VQVYSGIAALSDFRRTKLLNRLSSINKNITSVEAEYIHLADTEKLSASEDKQLQKLLTYGTPYEGKQAGQIYLVVPRPGTISPWSSKASDIVHNSGLEKVKRVERAVAYYVDGAPAGERAIAEILHDRMVESVLNNIEECSVLFETEMPDH